MSWAVPFDRVYDPIRAFCKRLTRNNSVEWEDLAQETYVKILTEYTDDVVDMLQWARTICYRTFASMLRAARKVWRSCLSIDDYGETISVDPNQEDRVLCRQLSELMSDKYAKRHLIEGWDYKEIMTYYNVSYATVADAVRNTRRKLNQFTLTVQAPWKMILANALNDVDDRIKNSDIWEILDRSGYQYQKNNPEPIVEAMRELGWYPKTMRFNGKLARGYVRGVK